MGDRVAIALSFLPLVDDATLERVARRPLVTELYLRGTRITDDGLKYLSGLTKLNRLDLAETGITDAGLFTRHRVGYAAGTLKDLLPSDGTIREELKAELLGLLHDGRTKGKSREVIQHAYDYLCGR